MKKVLIASIALALVASGCGTRLHRARAPRCEVSDQVILQAQAIPSASWIPCIEAFPVGWSFGFLDVRSDRSVFSLDSDRAGAHAVDITFTESCDVTGVPEYQTDEPGTDFHEKSFLTEETYSGVRYYLFEGGCVSYEFSFSGPGRSVLAHEVSQALSLISRDEVEADLAADDLELSRSGP